METAARALTPNSLPLSGTKAGSSSAFAFAAVALGIALLAALLAGSAPLGFSIATVFLFAGPHNWLEFRYFLSRMPAHWGPLRAFFLIAIGGAVLLTLSFAALPMLYRIFNWSHAGWSLVTTLWDTAAIAWIMVLVLLRSGQTPRRDWSWVYPIGFALIALVWLVPQAWDLALVYLHPCVALIFLDRELARRNHAWRRAYRCCLAALPLLLAFLWWRLADTPSLPGDDALTVRITRHAGASILSGVSSHLLVATHTFLESLHYGVWIVAIPLLSLKTTPWSLQSVPLYRRSSRWRLAVVGAMGCGVLVMLALWGGFVADYPLTRDIYFTAAMLHVLAEVPFLLRTF